MATKTAMITIAGRPNVGKSTLPATVSAVLSRKRILSLSL